MADPIALGSAFVDALEAQDLAAMRQIVPEKYWEWLDGFLEWPDGWQSIDELAGTPRRLMGSRALSAISGRLVIEGPLGVVFVTATFDDDGKLAGFAIRDEEFEGIGTVCITCPDERVDELREFYAVLVARDRRTRPRLNFDEGRNYRAPRWPDPEYPQQMHLDFHVRDIDAASQSVQERGGTLLEDRGSHRIYGDPIGHPFCLYPADADGLWRVVIDCPDAAELSAFYAALLGPDPIPTVVFQEVSPYIAPRWPDPDFPPQMHFDIAVDDREPVLKRIEPLGAVLVPPQGGSCPVYTDPAGHPFCLCLHGE